MINNHESKQNGLFGNEDLMHSLMNSIAYEIYDSYFASEKPINKTNRRPGRPDIVIFNQDTGIIIEMKYKGEIDKALEQAKSYRNSIQHCRNKIFLACKISQDKKVIFKTEMEYEASITSSQKI